MGPARFHCATLLRMPASHCLHATDSVSSSHGGVVEKQEILKEL